MSFANNSENNILKLIFNATAWANFADNAAGTPQTNTAVALHTADPGEAGDMTTSEAAYTSYGRASVARTTGGWTVTANSVSPVAAIAFPAGTGGSGSATFWSTGKTGGGATDILLSGAVAPAITMGSGVTPSLASTTTITLE